MNYAFKMMAVVLALGGVELISFFIT